MIPRVRILRTYFRISLSGSVNLAGYGICAPARVRIFTQGGVLKLLYAVRGRTAGGEAWRTQFVDQTRKTVTCWWEAEVLMSDQAHPEIPFETICTYSPRKSPHAHMYR